jgi:hypothetical protein
MIPSQTEILICTKVKTWEYGAYPAPQLLGMHVKLWVPPAGHHFHDLIVLSQGEQSALWLPPFQKWILFVCIDEQRPER